MLIEHDFPISQGWKTRESGRSLHFVCEGKEFDTLDSAIHYQSLIEDRPRNEALLARSRKRSKTKKEVK